MEENKNIMNAQELTEDQMEGAAGGTRGGVNVACWHCGTSIPSRYSASRIRVICPHCNRKYIIVSGAIVEEEVEKKK